MQNKIIDENEYDAAVTMQHAGMIRRKTFLKKLYREFYTCFKESIRDLTIDGELVELGSGGGFIKEIIPDVTTSDILDLPEIDRTFSALNMPFKDNSVKAFFMLNTLHHINNMEMFFREVERCLCIGGKLMAVEPANTLWSRFIFQKFHHERFDPSGSWCFEDQGPLFSSNGAIPWIVFFRDRTKFEEMFQSFKILNIKFHTPFRYIISGGFSIPQLLPSFTFNITSRIERILSPINRYIAMFQTIEIAKIKACIHATKSPALQD